MNISVIKRTMSKGVVKNPWLVVLFVLLLVTSSIPLVTHYAPTVLGQEKCAGGNWSNLQWRKNSPNIHDGKYVGPSGYAEVEFDWTAKKEAEAGSKFEFDLPKELKGVDTGLVVLKDNKGEIVATGQWDNEKKKFVVTLTDFQDRHFDVHGKVFLSVAWNTSDNFNGQLHFNGCGNDTLNGQFEKREGGLFHNDSKIGEYRGYDKKNGNYIIQWSVGINPKKHKDIPVTVTDIAPVGWDFTCDGNDNDGYAPVYVSSFIQGQDNKPKQIRHAIYDRDGSPSGGTRTGFTNVTHLEDFRDGHNYTINCDKKQVSVSFPRGLDEQSGPILTLTAVTKTKPAPGSIVTNKAKIDTVEVEGQVRFPNSGGQGFGRKGGFTVEKSVVGTPQDKTKDYTFTYECKDPQGNPKKNGSLTLKHEDLIHIDDLDKGWKCTVTENIPKDNRKLTVSWVAYGPNKEVKSIGAASMIDFVLDEKFAEATHVIVTNKFEEPTGSFTLGKTAIVTDNTKSEEFRNKIKDKKFKLDYVCTPPNVDGRKAEKRHGTVELANGQISSLISGLPIGTKCTVTENKTDINVEGYNYEKLEWQVNSETNSRTQDKDGYTFTVTEAKFIGTFGAVNTYKPVEPKPEPETGGFTILKQTLRSDRTVNLELSSKEFTFNWECTPHNQQGDKKSGSFKLKDKGVHKQENIPLGSTCVITEDEDSAKLDGYTHELSVNDEKVKKEGNRLTFKVDSKVTVDITAVNRYTPEKKPETSNFRISKYAAGFNSDGTWINDKKITDHEFKFTWECIPPKEHGNKQTGEFKVKDTSSFKSPDFPLGTTCTVIEDAESAKLDGYTHELVVDDDKIQQDGTKLTFTIDSQRMVSINAHNKYTPVKKPEPEKGKFKVTKTTTLIHEDNTASFDEKLSAHEFKFTWECTPPEGQGDKQTGDFMVKHKGEFESQELPVGTSCTVTETEESAKVNGFTHELRVDGEKVKQEGNRFSFTIGSETLLTIQARNEYTPVKKPGPELGQFTLVKEVKDADARAQLKGKKFTFEWECITDDGEPSKTGRVELGNGQGSLISGLPLNSSCTIKETGVEQLDGYTHTLKWLINGEPKSEDPIKVTPRKQSDNPLIVTAINEYTPVVPPVPPTTETTTTTEPAPTTSSTTMTTEPVPTTSTTQPVPTTSTTQPVPTTSSSTPTTTTTTSSEPIVPTTTHQVPPIIPIPIPIPIPPAPQPVPPVTTQVTPPVPSTPVTQSSTPAPSGKTQPGTGRSGLANTGASVNLIALLALLLAMIGGLIVFYTRGRRRS
ncbi:LPxTG domain-containing protein [Corynebacterium kutscheri]|nr:LPxTG domain-containing protein [Corynebacterium kutscheri]